MTEIYAFGSNLKQQIMDGTELGTQSIEPVMLPHKITLDDEFRLKFLHEAATETAVMMLDDGGPAKPCSYGNNAAANPPNTQCFPQRCIAASWSNIILATGNHVWVCGRETAQCDSVRKMTLEESVRHVSSSWHHTYVTCQDGSCHVLAGKHAQTMQKVVCPKPGLASVSAGELYTCAITTDGETGIVDQTDEGAFIYRPLVSKLNIKSVSCGKEHVLLRTGIGVVFSFGLGSRGQLGHVSIEKVVSPSVIEALEGVRMVDVSAGGWHSAAVSDIGDVYMWGWNESGQLGLPSKNISEQTKDRSRSCQCDKEERVPMATGKTEVVNILPLPHLVDIVTQTSQSHEEREVNVVSVSCGSRHTVVLSDEGSLYSWGWNGQGQLGHGDILSRDTPCLVSFFDERKLKVKQMVAGSWSTVAMVDVRR